MDSEGLESEIRRKIQVVDTEDPPWLLAQFQPQLKAYILSMLSSSDEADDILQEANTYILTHIDQYERGSNFKGWVLKVAYFRVRAHIRDRQRRGYVELSDGMLERISNMGVEHLEQEDERLMHLSQCVRRLNAEQRLLLRWKYVDRVPFSELAHKTEESAAKLYKTLSRLRKSLRHCIEQKSTSTL
ncbi:sigma-70 family RNA polymerase sigma factor [Rubritalea tangerina]|uniref:Sigma-70 family RNA polymerase sigma factor n=1 Tax=Rubritalea tangerina TaxID=430798 RepID=A0ABW4ZAH9_9BACT